MKSNRLVSFLAYMLVAAVLVACSNTHTVGEQCPSVLSLSKEEACEILGVKKGELNEVAIGTYNTPLKAELADQIFDVSLGFNTESEEQELLCITYRLNFADLSDDTAQTVDAIVAALDEQFGESTGHNDFKGKDKSIPTGYTTWDLTDTVNKELSAYLKQLEAEYGGPGYYQVNLQISELDGHGEVTIEYRIGVIPSK